MPYPRAPALSAAIAIVATTTACGFECVDTFGAPQRLRQGENRGGADVFAAPPGGLWWTTRALGTTHPEIVDRAGTVRPVEIALTTGTSTAVRVPNDLEPGSAWTIAIPGEDLTLSVLDPSDAPSTRTAAELEVSFVDSKTTQYSGGSCTGDLESGPQATTIPDLVFQTGLSGNDAPLVLLDVWLIASDAVPSEDERRAVDTLLLTETFGSIPALFNVTDRTVHISPHEMPAGDAAFIRLRDLTTAATGNFASAVF